MAKNAKKIPEDKQTVSAQELEAAQQELALVKQELKELREAIAEEAELALTNAPLCTVSIQFAENGTHDTSIEGWDKIPKGLAGLQRALNRAPAEYLRLRAQAINKNRQKEQQTAKLRAAEEAHQSQAR